MTISPVSDSGFPELEGLSFRAPWEAQIFALICALREAGKLPPAEWSAALGEEIQLAQKRGDPDLGDTYHAHCLAALEKWLLRADLATRDELAQRIADWREAYLRTPHGHPVELR